MEDSRNRGDLPLAQQGGSSSPPSHRPVNKRPPRCRTSDHEARDLEAMFERQAYQLSPVAPPKVEIVPSNKSFRT